MEAIENADFNKGGSYKDGSQNLRGKLNTSCHLNAISNNSEPTVLYNSTKDTATIHLLKTKFFESNILLGSN